MQSSEGQVFEDSDSHLFVTPLSEGTNEILLPQAVSGWLIEVKNEPVAAVATNPVVTQTKNHATFSGSSLVESESFLRRVHRSSLPRPESGHIPEHKPAALDDIQETNKTINHSTAEIAANSPRYRRRSSTFIDAVHDLTGDANNTGKPAMAPAQLYSTMSGRLFHSGRIVIVLVGPPARGKTSVVETFPAHV